MQRSARESPRGGEESTCGGGGGCSKRAKCGCPRDSDTMNIMNEFKQLYEDKLRLIDEEGGSGDCTVQAKLNLQQDWIRDLTEQNEMLVRSVEELELEATERVLALEKRLKHTSKRASEVMNGYKDYSFDLEEKFRETERLRNDLTNLLTLLKTDCNGNSEKANLDAYRFYTVEDDVLEGIKSQIEANFHGTQAVKAIEALHEKEEEIKELEVKIKEMQSAPTVITTEYAELKQSMLDMRDALTAEVAEKHDAIVALKRDVQMLEEQCRKADQQTHFKDDIIKELRKEIKQLRLEKQTKICWPCNESTVELIAGLEAKCQNLMSKFENRPPICVCPRISSTTGSFKELYIKEEIYQSVAADTSCCCTDLDTIFEEPSEPTDFCKTKAVQAVEEDILQLSKRKPPIDAPTSVANQIALVDQKIRSLSPKKPKTTRKKTPEVLPSSALKQITWPLDETESLKKLLPPPSPNTSPKIDEIKAEVLPLPIPLEIAKPDFVLDDNQIIAPKEKIVWLKRGGQPETKPKRSESPPSLIPRPITWHKVSDEATNQIDKKQSPKKSKPLESPKATKSKKKHSKRTKSDKVKAKVKKENVVSSSDEDRMSQKSSYELNIVNAIPARDQVLPKVTREQPKSKSTHVLHRQDGFDDGQFSDYENESMFNSGGSEDDTSFTSSRELEDQLLRPSSFLEMDELQLKKKPATGVDSNSSMNKKSNLKHNDGFDTILSPKTSQMSRENAEIIRAVEKQHYRRRRGEEMPRTESIVRLKRNPGRSSAFEAHSLQHDRPSMQSCVNPEDDVMWSNNLIDMDRMSRWNSPERHRHMMWNDGHLRTRSLYNDRMMSPSFNRRYPNKDYVRPDYFNLHGYPYDHQSCIFPIDDDDPLRHRKSNTLYYRNSIGQLTRAPRYISGLPGDPNGRRFRTGSLNNDRMMGNFAFNLKPSMYYNSLYRKRNFNPNYFNAQSEVLDGLLTNRSSRSSMGETIRPLRYQEDPYYYRKYAMTRLGPNTYYRKPSKYYNTLYRRGSLNPNYFNAQGAVEDELLIPRGSSYNSMDDPYNSRYDGVRRLGSFYNDRSNSSNRHNSYNKSGYRQSLDDFEDPRMIPRRSGNSFDLNHRRSSNEMYYRNSIRGPKYYDAGRSGNYYSTNRQQSSVNPHDEFEQRNIRPTRSRSVIDLRKGMAQRDSFREIIRSPKGKKRSGKKGRAARMDDRSSYEMQTSSPVREYIEPGRNQTALNNMPKVTKSYSMRSNEDYERQAAGGLIDTAKSWLPFVAQSENPYYPGEKKSFTEKLKDSLSSLTGALARHLMSASASRTDSESSHRKERKAKKLSYTLPESESEDEVESQSRSARLKPLEDRSIIFANSGSKKKMRDDFSCCHVVKRRLSNFDDRIEMRAYMKLLKRKLKKGMLKRIEAEIEDKATQIAAKLKQVGGVTSEDIEVIGQPMHVPSLDAMRKGKKAGGSREDEEDNIIKMLRNVKKEMKKSITKKVNTAIENKAVELAHKGFKRFSKERKVKSSRLDIGVVDSISQLEDSNNSSTVKCCCSTKLSVSDLEDIDVGAILSDVTGKLKKAMLVKVEDALEEKRLNLVKKMGLNDDDLKKLGKDVLRNANREAGGMDLSVVPTTSSELSTLRKQSDQKVLQDLVMGSANKAIWNSMQKERQLLVDDILEKDKQLMDLHELVSVTMRRLVTVFDGFQEITEYTDAIKEREKLLELEEENSELKEVIKKSTHNLTALGDRAEELITDNNQLQQCQLEYVQKIEILEAEKAELLSNCCQMQDKLEKISHVEEISIESEHTVQTLRIELQEMQRKNEDCLSTIECLSCQKQEQCCKIEALEDLVRDLSKKIATNEVGVQWSRASSPKGCGTRRCSPRDEEGMEREEKVFTFDLNCTGNRDKKSKKRRRSKSRRKSDVENSSDKDESNDDTMHSENSAHHTEKLNASRFKNKTNFHDDNYKNQRNNTHHNINRYHSSSQEEFENEDDEDKMLVVRRKPSTTSLIDDDFSDISQIHSEQLTSTKINRGHTFSDSTENQSDASSSHDHSKSAKKVVKIGDRKRKCPSRRAEDLCPNETQVAKILTGRLTRHLKVQVKNSRTSCGSDNNNVKVVKLTAISTNAQPWCQLQGAVHDIKDSVSRIIVRENEVKLAQQRIAELEEQVQWIRKKDEIIDIQNDTLNIVENELQAYRTMECEVEAARGCREREVCNLKQTIHTLLLNLNDEKQRSENLQKAVDLYLNSISVLETSESSLKREVSEQKVTIGNLQEALVSVKQGLEEQRSRSEQEFECFEQLVEKLRDENLVLEEGLFFNCQDVEINESRLLKYQQLFKELTNECTHLKQELMQLEVQKVDQDAFVEELNSQLVDCKNELRHLYLILTREQELMEDESSKLAKEIVRMQEEIFTLSEQLAYSSRSLENEKKTVSAMEVMVAKKDCEMVCFKKEIQILEEKLQMSSGEITGLKRRLHEVQTVRGEEVKRMQELQGNYQKRSQELEIVKADYTTTSNTLKNVQMELRNSEDRHISEIGQLKIIVTGLKEQLIAVDTKAKCYERELELARVKISETTDDEMKLIQEKTLRETAYNEDRREYQREQNRLIDVVTTLEQRLAVINCEICQKDKELDDLKVSLVSASSEAQIHCEEICSLKNEINTLIQKQTIMKAENDVLQGQVGKLRSVVAKNDEKNEIMMRELEQCLAELQVIQRDKDFLMEKNTALAREIRSLQNACQLKTESMVTLEMELSDTRSIKETLCNESKHIIDNVKSWLHEQQKLNVELNNKIKSKNTLIAKLNEKVASLETRNRCQSAPSPCRAATPPRGWSLGSCESPPCSWSSEVEWETVDNEATPQVWLHRVESLTEELQRNNRYWKSRMNEHDYVVSRDN